MFRRLALPLLLAAMSLSAGPAWAIPKNIKAVLPEPSSSTSTSRSYSARTYWSPGARCVAPGWTWQPRWRRVRH